MTFNESFGAPEQHDAPDIDPPRDAALRRMLDRYEADRAVPVDDALRVRLLAPASAALAARVESTMDARWTVATARLARVAVPLGVLAAAASLVFVTRTAPLPTSNHPLMTVALGGDSASVSPAQLWNVARRCDADVMCGAFGQVTR